MAFRRPNMSTAVNGRHRGQNRDITSRLIGDGLVPIDSALGLMTIRRSIWFST